MQAGCSTTSVLVQETALGPVVESADTSADSGESFIFDYMIVMKAIVEVSDHSIVSLLVSLERGVTDLSFDTYIVPVWYRAKATKILQLVLPSFLVCGCHF